MNRLSRIASITSTFAFAAVLCPMAVAETRQNASVQSLLQEKFDLASPRSSQTQYYRMETTIIAYGPDGKPTSRETYRLLLRCVPGSRSGVDFDQYTCRRFALQQGDSVETSIPALEGWTYAYDRTTTLDEKGQVLGIDHGKFEGLTDSSGAALPPDKAYLVYNTFIDFHAFCNVFAEATSEGTGIQDLNRIGQQVVHAAAFSEPPVELGSNVAEGSTFKNGEITLAFKGLSIVDNAPCALVAFDSGQSSFTMFLEPVPNVKITTVGGSHYQGDIYIDLESRWVRKVMMTELVVSETELPVPPNKINVVHERSTTIKSVTAEAFSRK
ncbi:MAG: hypothetical protein ACYTG0_32350 [Planctomycetota bacterium]